MIGDDNQWRGVVRALTIGIAGGVIACVLVYGAWFSIYRTTFEGGQWYNRGLMVLADYFIVPFILGAVLGYSLLWTLGARTFGDKRWVLPLAGMSGGVALAAVSRLSQSLLRAVLGDEYLLTSASFLFHVLPLAGGVTGVFIGCGVALGIQQGSWRRYLPLAIGAGAGCVFLARLFAFGYLPYWYLSAMASLPVILSVTAFHVAIVCYSRSKGEGWHTE